MYYSDLCGLRHGRRAVALKSGERVLAELVHVHAAAEELGDLTDAVLDHRRPLHADPPSEDLDVVGKAHGHEHLRTEDTRVAELDPLLQPRMVAEDLHGRLGV